jgi:hypothetical protein
MHEFGHTMNLTHEDYDEMSLMYPYTDDNQVISESTKCFVTLSIWESEQNIGQEKEALTDGHANEDMLESGYVEGNNTCYTE